MKDFVSPHYPTHGEHVVESNIDDNSFETRESDDGEIDPRKDDSSFPASQTFTSEPKEQAHKDGNKIEGQTTKSPTTHRSSNHDQSPLLPETLGDPETNHLFDLIQDLFAFCFEVAKPCDAFSSPQTYGYLAKIASKYSDLGKLNESSTASFPDTFEHTIDAIPCGRDNLVASLLPFLYNTAAAPLSQIIRSLVQCIQFYLPVSNYGDVCGIFHRNIVKAKIWGVNSPTTLEVLNYSYVVVGMLKRFAESCSNLTVAEGDEIVSLTFLTYFHSIDINGVVEILAKQDDNGACAVDAIVQVTSHAHFSPAYPAFELTLAFVQKVRSELLASLESRSAKQQRFIVALTHKMHESMHASLQSEVKRLDCNLSSSTLKRLYPDEDCFGKPMLFVDWVRKAWTEIVMERQGECDMSAPVSFQCLGICKFPHD